MPREIETHVTAESEGEGKGNEDEIPVDFLYAAIALSDLLRILEIGSISSLTFSLR